MVFIILRHGETIYNKQNILSGKRDIELTEKGIKDTIKVCDLLKKYNFDYIFTSELKRTKESATIIKKELNQNCIIKSSMLLNEKNYGYLTGRNIYELENVYTPENIKKWRRSYYTKAPGGESLQDVHNRCGDYFDTFIKPLLKENKNVLMVGHSNILRSLFVHLQLKNSFTIEDFEIKNCCPINIDIKNKKYYYENN
jgi:2,3-bisphosphoglycerate-dependent phosphoglycerate mutase